MFSVTVKRQVSIQQSKKSNFDADTKTLPAIQAIPKITHKFIARLQNKTKQNFRKHKWDFLVLI